MRATCDSLKLFSGVSPGGPRFFRMYITNATKLEEREHYLRAAEMNKLFVGPSI